MEASRVGARAPFSTIGRWYKSLYTRVVRHRIHHAVQEALSRHSYTIGTIDLSRPRRERGEYATGVALAVARAHGGEPLAVAKQLQASLQELLPDISITVASPGFLNFHLPRSFFTEQVAQACSGNLQAPVKEGKRVFLEYMSPNLFKPLHVGNLVGAIVGESLARIAEFCGDTVTRFSYPSDIGLTVAKAVWGLKKSGADPDSIDALGVAYREGSEAYESTTASREEIIALNRALYEGSDSALSALKERGLRTSLQHIEQIAEQFGIRFDELVFESQAAEHGVRLVREHLSDGVFEEDDGAVVFRGEKEGLHTRVFLNSHGLPTYEAKELGNFFEKQRRVPEWDALLVVTGSEQKEYFSVLYTVLRRIFSLPKEKVLEHVATGFLTLEEGKMSSRKGTVLTGESVLSSLRGEALKRTETMRTNDPVALSEQIAVGALVYRILRHRVGSAIVFSLRQAFSFEGDSGPYVQYTYARVCSVLEKAKENGLTAEVTTPFPEAVAVEKLLHRFSEAVATSYTDRSPHHLVAYLTELSASFNTFYAKERIVGEPDHYTSYRVAITVAVGATLKKGMWLLGIPSPSQF